MQHRDPSLESMRQVPSSSGETRGSVFDKWTARRVAE